MDVSEQFAMLLVSLEKRVLQKEDELAQFRVRAEQYCRDQAAEISKAKAQVEIIRAQMLELKKAPLVDNPLAPANGEVQPTSTVNQSDRIREAARAILSEAGKPVMQLELKKLMEAKGVYIHARNPVDLIRSALRRGSEFEHIHHQGWTLTKPRLND